VTRKHNFHFLVQSKEKSKLFLLRDSDTHELHPLINLSKEKYRPAFAIHQLL